MSAVQSVTRKRTPAKRNARQLATNLRQERPDYMYLKEVFRQPRAQLGNRCHGGKGVVGGAGTVGRNALDRAQLVRLLANDLQDAIAETLDRLRRPDWTQVGGVRDQQGHAAPSIQMIDELDRADL